VDNGYDVGKEAMLEGRVREVYFEGPYQKNQFFRENFKRGFKFELNLRL
jgi:hypothetical protein